MHVVVQTTVSRLLARPTRLRLTLVGLLVVSVWVLCPERPEPGYGGKTLSGWLRNRDPDFQWVPNDVYGHIHDELWERLTADQAQNAETSGHSAPSPSPTISPETAAVRAIGTNALPWLVRWMSARSTASDRLLEQVVAHLPLSAARLFSEHSGGIWAKRASRWRIAALDGFTALGAKAAPALPALKQLLIRSDADMPLTCAIANIGPSGITLLAQALNDPDSNVRDQAALALGLSGESARSALPELLHCVERGQASYHVLGAIGRIGGADPRLVPDLIQLLESGQPSIESLPGSMVPLILGLKGAQAQPALPSLIRLFNHSATPLSVSDRRLLRRVIRSISPEAERQLPPPLEGEVGNDWP